jgi:hypothetical protein
MKRTLLLLAGLLSGCAALEGRAPEFDAGIATPAGASVIVLVRPQADAFSKPTVVVLEGRGEALTYPGSVTRWTVAPGVHRIAGFGSDGGALELHTAPDRVYHVRQTVTLLHDLPQSRFEAVEEREARAAAARGDPGRS